MTAVTFYHVKAPRRQAKALLVCQLVATAYRKGHRVYVNVQNEDQSLMLDQLLWTYSPSSFIPHTRLSENPDPNLDKYPVVIGIDDPPEKFNDVLISLKDQVPPYVSRFQRVVEPIDANSQDQAKAKLRFSQYQSLFRTEPKNYFI